MTTVPHAPTIPEASAFPLWNASLPEPSTGKLVVVMRRDERIDLLVLSDQEKSARLLPNVGEQITDALGALVQSGYLPDTSAIMVIHQLATDVAASNSEENPAECSAASDLVRSYPCQNLQQSVREDMAFLRSSPHILNNTEVSGLMYHVSSRHLFPVTSSYL